MGSVLTLVNRREKGKGKKKKKRCKFGSFLPILTILNNLSLVDYETFRPPMLG